MNNSNFFLASIQLFNGGEPDKNGNDPVILVPIAGTCPKKRVLAGTVANNSGFEVGFTYLVKWTFLGDDPEYGKEYGFLPVSKVEDVMLIIGSSEKLGPVKDVE